MKQLSLVLNLVLLIAVGFLFYKVFSGKKNNESSIEKKAVNDTAKSHSMIAWLDIDSLQNNYDYYKLKKSEFEKRQQSVNSELDKDQNAYQQKVAEIQKKGQTMTQQEQEAAMQEINQMQQTFQAHKQELENSLYDASAKMKDDILKRIQLFLKDYNKGKNYQYIFSYEPGFMFYKDSTLDITNDVINGLNEAYKKEQQ